MILIAVCTLSEGLFSICCAMLKGVCGLHSFFLFFFGGGSFCHEIIQALNRGEEKNQCCNQCCGRLLGEIFSLTIRCEQHNCSGKIYQVKLKCVISFFVFVIYNANVCSDIKSKSILNASLFDTCIFYVRYMMYDIFGI